MPSPNAKLAATLEHLAVLQRTGDRVFQSSQFQRTDRERLLKHGFLQEVVKGWLISSSPASRPGDTTPWFASFWQFCRRYCDTRYGRAWHLAPSQSLQLHAEQPTIPTQVIVHSPRAGNNRIDLLFGTSLFALKTKVMPPADDLELKDGLRIFRPAAALTLAPPDFFGDDPLAAQIVASAIRDPGDLISRLLDRGLTSSAGRLAGLFRHLGRPDVADEIRAAMRAADYAIRETDPLVADHAVVTTTTAAAPIVARLQAMWATTRSTVIAELPADTGPPRDRTRYLETIDEVYKLDAYHSLSIEGYQVTPELIQRVASGAWRDGLPDADRDHHALAAHGYWLAFQRVRATAELGLKRDNSQHLVRAAHRDWYRAMFTPHVGAGMLRASMLAGYRTAPVYLQGSRHVPPRSELMADAMPALFDLIEHEPVPAVRAVLGHWLFGYIHPFADGNGRIARFLMNVLLTAGGYPWTVIRVDDRDAYLAALEIASASNDVRPFARFIASQMKRSRPRKPGMAT